jgi:formate-dependent nitrite reductase membrane component NrfD
VTLVAAAEHFAGDPEWTWYILAYFFLAGLAGGSYFLATLLRHWGDPTDEPVARLGFYVAFPATVVSAILLTLDLKQPLRFWHMLVNTTPDAFGLNFNTATPMSVGVWALLVASIFGAVSFVDALVRDGKIRGPLGSRLARLLEGRAGRVWNVVGALLYLFIAGYTGVLLAVSNQPVWSDTWALGGLFLASGLSGSTALLLLLAHYRRAPASSRRFLEIGGRLFAALELLLLVVLLLTLIGDGTLGKALEFPWLLLWLVALAGILPALRDLAVSGLNVTAERTIAAGRANAWAVAPGLALIGVLALRAAVIFSAPA